MRIVIEKEIKLNNLDKYQKKILNDCSVHFREAENYLFLQEQKIDLTESDMENILDIIHWEGDGRIVLERYERGRYYLK